MFGDHPLGLPGILESWPGAEVIAHRRTRDHLAGAPMRTYPQGAPDEAAEARLMESADGPPDVMVVIGGYNSSNTNHLAVICSRHTTTYHISDADRIDAERGTIRFKPAGTPLDAPEVEAEAWLVPGPITVGLTAGASTPNNKIGEAIERLLASRGIELPQPRPYHDYDQRDVEYDMAEHHRIEPGGLVLEREIAVPRAVGAAKPGQFAPHPHTPEAVLDGPLQRQRDLRDGIFGDIGFQRIGRIVVAACLCAHRVMNNPAPPHCKARGQGPLRLPLASG